MNLIWNSIPNPNWNKLFLIIFNVQAARDPRLKSIAFSKHGEFRSYYYIRVR